MRFGGVKLTVSACATLMLFASMGSANAAKIQHFQDDICRKQTRLQERTLRVPDHLLTAISLAETGRWVPERKAMFAWPWTVTAKGKGTFYETKEEAIKAVQSLQKKGVKSIDVGCMQINLLYHPRAFSTLEDAFSPESNVAYASQFLGQLQDQTQSWQTAAAHYHSTNPSVNQRYQKKVLKLWRQIGGDFARLNLDRPVDINPADAEQQRRAQQELFNTRFRARLSAERSHRKPERGQTHLDAWRAGQGQSSIYSQFSSRQRAERERRQILKLQGKKSSFAEKRKRQLAVWRLKQGQIARERAVATAKPQQAIRR